MLAARIYQLEKENASLIKMGKQMNEEITELSEALHEANMEKE